MILSLQLLGGLQARLDGEPLAPRAAQRKRLALLALLAAAPSRALTRDQILVLLWPEYDTERARHQLAASTHDIRHAIAPDLVVAAADELRLNPSLVDCDVWSFEAALQKGDLAEAVARYTGPLLDGVHLPGDREFGHWVDAERDRLARSFAAAVEELAVRDEAAGEFAAAAERWRRRATCDPFDSRVAVRLMQALAAAGNRAGAIQHGRVHAALVRTEFETEPDAAVLQLTTRLCSAPPASAPALSSAPVDSQAVPAATRVREPVEPTMPVPADDAPGDVAGEVTPAAAAEIVARPSRRVWLGAAATLVALVALGTVAGNLLVRDGQRSAAAMLPADPPAQAASTTTADPHPWSAAMVRSTDPQARDLYMRARMEWDERNSESLQRAVVLYRQATERDPGYAAAYSGLAESYAMLGYFGFEPGDAMFPKASAAAHRAIDLDPQDGDAYAALGQALAWQHRWSEADATYRRGLEVAPNNPTVHQWYGLLFAYLGRPVEAAQQTAVAARLDPLSVQINNMLGAMLSDAGDTQGALRQFERTVNAEPDSAWVRENPWVLSNYGSVAAAAGRHEQAVRLIERALQVVPSHPRPLLDLARAYLSVNDTASARAAFARADTTNPQYAMYRGLFHASLGEIDSAFAWLDRVHDWSLPALVTLNSSPGFGALRADPRYTRIRARLGMPPR